MDVITTGLEVSGWVVVIITVSAISIKNRQSKIRDFRMRVEKFRKDVNDWFNQLSQVVAKLQGSLTVWSREQVMAYLEALTVLQGTRFYVPYCDEFYQEISKYEQGFPKVVRQLGELRELYSEFRFSVLQYKKEVDLAKIIREKIEPSDDIFDDISRIGLTTETFERLRQELNRIDQLRQQIFKKAGELIQKSQNTILASLSSSAYKLIRTIFSSLWRGFPCWIAILALVGVIFLSMDRKPDFVDLDKLNSGNLTEAQKQTVTMATELNKFLISLATLMFGALSFYLIQYRKRVQVRWLDLTLLLVVTLLGFAYYFAFMTYSQLTAELAQNALAMFPEKSRTLYYLEMEFWAFIGASLTMLSIFVLVFAVSRNQGRGGQ